MGAMQQMLLATSGATGPTDPYFAFVKSLLHFDGTNGSTTITDVTGRTWSVGGGATLDTSGPKWGSAAGNAPRASGSFFSTAHSTDLDLDTGPGGFEFWYKPTTLPSSGQFHFLLSKGNNAAAGYCIFLFGNDGKLYMRNNATELVTPALHGMSTGTWYHLRFGKDNSNNNYIGLNGALLTSGTAAISANSTGLILGAITGSGEYANGQYDDFRFDKGVNRYGTGSYTVPTAAHPNS